MQIGVPKEIKAHEYRVGLTPASVRELVALDQQVLVETRAGVGAGFSDEDYEAAGATIVTDAEELFARADLVVKVKEPQLVECRRLRESQVLFTYLHLAADPAQAEALMESGATAVAYETVTSADGALPLLTPMSRIAGRMAAHVGAHYLEKPCGGTGVLIGGVAGVPAARVVVLGAGVAGTSAVEMAVGLQADVTVFDKDVRRLNTLAERFGNRLRTLYATRDAIEQSVLAADVVIGSVLLPGAAAPKLVSAEVVDRMRPGAVVVDISIDQGGCFATSRPTTHADPTYTVGGVVHYCVANMPGAVPKTSTIALNNATLPYVKAIATQGWNAAATADPHLAAGLNVRAGKLYHDGVSSSLAHLTPARRRAS